MIDLAGELRRRSVDFEMRLLGLFQGETLEEDMRRAVRQASLGGHVGLIGRVPFEQAQHQVASADIGICLYHPTPHHLNSLPNKLLEYMSHRLPVVASDFDCWREYVTGVGSGIQVDPLCVKEIADAVQWLLEHPAEMRRMGRLGRQAVEERYCWEQESRKLLAFYEKLLRRS